ncbi:imidazole glycerol phosphate synthase subunit HisH [Tenacibaculum sp. 190524A05c]|uniref:imidazole glycerol phosphate synthase subunit HisH n=1 Tax=Tenacibaculum platacis TaxID=3137852 RepID=UPI0032B30236
MIGIVDYGSGNIYAIATIFKNLNIPHKIISKPDELEEASKLILPGVGAFDETMQQLINSGLQEKLNYLVLEKKTPVFGICVGMQILGNGSDEGELKGLGWIPGNVKKFDERTIPNKPHLPHMGWNTIKNSNNHPIFNNIDEDFGFYFVHSYYFECENEEHILSKCNYGIEFASSIYNNHIFGMQFHPEKSHGNGVQLLKNFAELEYA